MSDHAFLAPSGASMWGPGRCAYYPTMAAKYPQAEDDIGGLAAEAGTAAHELLANWLLDGDAQVGDIAANQVVFDAEMAEAAGLAAEQILAVRAKTGSQGHVETVVRMPQVHKDCWGTADFFDVDGPGNTVYVVDFKYGHRHVDAWENYQLVLYGLGALNHFGIVPDGAWDFVFTIVQPRSYHADGPVKAHRMAGKRFMQLVGELREAAAAATGPMPHMATGPWCNDCEGRIRCDAFQRAAGAALDVSLLSGPNEPSPASVGTLRTYVAAAIKRLEGMASGLDAEIERSARAGNTVPGWELKPKDTRLDWKVPLAEVHALGDMMGIPTRKEAAITPTQAIKAGIDEAVISEYAERPPGGLKVVPSSKTAAAKAFSN